MASCRLLPVTSPGHCAKVSFGRLVDGFPSNSHQASNYVWLPGIDSRPARQPRLSAVGVNLFVVVCNFPC